MPSPKKILVTGANGQLGSELRAIADAWPAFNVVFLTRDELPLEDAEKAAQVLQQHEAAFFVNCAAYTAVDKAESEQNLAFRINAEAPGLLAGLCSKRNIRFIHISTDYVFDGMGTSPYLEDAPTNPQSVYGSTKLEGERRVQQNDPAAVIIRTSWVYSVFGKNFVKTMLRLMQEKPAINVVNDQFGSPTSAADLAAAILQIISAEEWHPGIYHYSNSGIISWHEFALAIKELTGSACEVNPIPTSGYPTPARRPAYSVMNTQKIRQTYGIEINDWKSSLATCLTQLLHN